MKKITGLFIIIVFISVSLFLNLAMRFDADGMMGSDCPLTNATSDCASLAGHLNFFSTVFIVTILTQVLVSLLPIFTAIFYRPELFPSLEPFLVYFKKYRSDITLFNPLKVAISDGRLSPLLYA